MKIKELKGKDEKGLKKLLAEKKLEAAKSKISIVTGKEKNLKAYSNLRHETAKILTLLREMEIVEKLKGENK